MKISALHLTARTQNKKFTTTLKKDYIRIMPHTYLSWFFTYHFADSIFYDCANSIPEQKCLRLIESEMN